MKTDDYESERDEEQELRARPLPSAGLRGAGAGPGAGAGAGRAEEAQELPAEAVPAADEGRARAEAEALQTKTHYHYLTETDDAATNSAAMVLLQKHYDYLTETETELAPAPLLQGGPHLLQTPGAPPLLDSTRAHELCSLSLRSQQSGSQQSSLSLGTASALAVVREVREAGGCGGTDELTKHSQSQSSSSLGTASAMAVAREQELRAGHFPSAGLRGRAGRGGAGREAFPFPFPPAPVVQGGGPHLLQRPQGAPLLQSHGHGKRAPLLKVPLGGACGAE